MASSDFNEAEEFDEYNPHPYQGGYDIALTYGSPLPPSSATCYPISGTASGGSASSPAIDSPGSFSGDGVSGGLASSPVVDPPARSSDDGVSGGLASSPVVDAPARSSDDGVSDLGKQDGGYPWYNYPQPPELFGCRVSYGWSEDCEEKGFWRSWKRAADYLFGYSQGYGERRIGVDSYGIPIYANKRTGGDLAMSVQVEPASDQRVAFYEVHGDQIERDWSWDANYHDEQGNVESHFDGNPNPIYAYERHRTELPFSVELKPAEHSWLESVDYHQVHEEQWPSETHLHASSYHGWGGEKYVSEPNFYEKHYNEQPVYGELEPYQPTWTRYPTYFKDDTEKVLQESKNCSPLCQGNNKRRFYGNTIYAYEKHYHEQPLNIELKPVEHSWLENVNHYEVLEEHLAPEAHWHSSYNACGEENHGNQNLNYLCDRHCDEQPVYDELEPYQPTQSRYLSYSEAYLEEVPQESNKRHFWVSICLNGEPVCSSFQWFY